MNKKKLGIISVIVLAFVGFGFIYNKAHTNSPDDIKDYTGKYILNPEYKEFHKYQLTDLKSFYPTKLAYDSAWFKLPPEKYIPKEQSIPKKISNISDPIIRRQAYFNFLCKTEGIIYRTTYYNSITKIGATNFPQENGILYLNQYLNIPKINNIKDYTFVESQIKILNELNGNPFINPLYSSYFYPLIEGHTYNFSGVDIDINSKSVNKPLKNSSINQFVEFMSPEGKIFKIEYSSNLQKFLPSKIIPVSTARFYILTKPITRDEMKNLGIYGTETIVYDRSINKTISYSKNFIIGAFLPWTVESNISNFSWANGDSCQIKPNLIEEF